MARAKKDKNKDAQKPESEISTALGHIPDRLKDLTPEELEAGKAVDITVEQFTNIGSEKRPGQPTKYNPEYCQKAYEFCLLGATNKELADHFGVALSTLQEWKLVYPEFSDAIKRGKTPADAAVANALYKRAKGAKYKEQQAFKLKKVIYENGKKIAEEERIEVVELDKEVPPDTTAAIKWLSNRRSTAPADSIPWRDKVDVDANVQTGPIVIHYDDGSNNTKE